MLLTFSSTYIRTYMVYILKAKDGLVVYRKAEMWYQCVSSDTSEICCVAIRRKYFMMRCNLICIIAQHTICSIVYYFMLLTQEYFNIIMQI